MKRNYKRTRVMVIWTYLDESQTTFGPMFQPAATALMNVAKKHQEDLGLKKYTCLSREQWLEDQLFLKKDISNGNPQA